MLKESCNREKGRIEAKKQRKRKMKRTLEKKCFLKKNLFIPSFLFLLLVLFAFVFVFFGSYHFILVRFVEESQGEAANTEKVLEVQNLLTGKLMDVRKK